jgi:dTDP-4-amino-4,6-dideoxygalactose transaminase
MYPINPYHDTEEFEKSIADYTGAPYVVALDSCSSGIFLSLMFEGVKDRIIHIPSRTYMSVPSEIIHAGAKVRFIPMEEVPLKGAYQLLGSKTWDSALRFTADMYIPGSFMCCSFTGATKVLKLGKGGCILTDNKEAYEWFKKARFSGREACNYHDQKSFEMTGWNFYLNPMLSTLGLILMGQFYNFDKSKKTFPDAENMYPDLSLHSIYTK